MANDLLLRTHPLNDGSADKWAAFLLSLAVPGAGQLFARHPSYMVWFGCVAAISTASTLVASFSPEFALGFNIAVLPCLSFVSAEHAKRCLKSPSSCCKVVSHVVWEAKKASAVGMRIELDVPWPREEVWQIVSDFDRFIRADPFHRRVLPLHSKLRPGTVLALEHNAFGLSFWRFGRLLSWDDGRGFAFSDLSARGPRHGFPHVFYVSVQSIDPGHTRLQVAVRGKWTARWVPCWARRCWLSYVCHEHARMLRGLFAERNG
jgi:hypothetical protein